MQGAGRHCAEMNKHISRGGNGWIVVGKRHETFDRIKNGIYNFSDEKFNSIAHSFSTKSQMTSEPLGNLF
jgi:hypothetical protein